MNNTTTENSVEAQCAGKQGFAKRSLALTIARKGSHSKDKPMAAYVCPHCRMWHVGQSILKKTQAGVDRGMGIVEKHS